VTATDRRRFGYMPEERGLYPKMRVLEQTVYLARLHGWTPAAAHRNATELLERLGLAERLDDTVESLSLGNQQRAQIAAALVHRPEVLVLDEPFSGLDPMAVETVQSVLADAAAQGAPVLFSSHQLDVVERLCDDLVIIAGGRIRAAGSREALRAEHGSERWELLTTGDAGWVRGIPGVEVVSFDGGWALFEASTESARHAVLAEAVSRGDVVSFGREQTTLAQIFTEVVR
jgi:ABC-2 type transport system ATP-binding protein